MMTPVPNHHDPKQPPLRPTPPVVPRNKTTLTQFYETKLRDEVDILSVLHHANIIGLRDVIEEPRFYYLILEKMQGGELFDHVVRKKFATELQVRNVCKMMLSAIAYCHEHSIVHRDIKPENILLTVRILITLYRFVCGLEEDGGGTQAWRVPTMQTTTTTTQRPKGPFTLHSGLPHIEWRWFRVPRGTKKSL